MIYVLLNIITLAACFGIILTFRQSDKNNRSIEKARRYGERIKEDLEAFINEKNAGLSEVATELGVQQTRAIAAAKKLDEVYSQFMNNVGVLEDRSAAIQEIDRYVVRSEQTIQKLMDMTSLAEKNLTQITKEADFIESLAKSINLAKAELNSIASRIPEMQNRFAEEADKKLDQYKAKILEEMGLVIDDVEKRLAEAQKSTNDLLDVASIKFQDIYKQAYSTAADKAGALQEAAFTKLKEHTAEKIQNYKQEFEEMSSQIEERVNKNIEEAKLLVENFKTDWDAQAKDYLAEMYTNFSNAEGDISQKLDAIMDKLKETENSVSLSSDSLASELNQTESTMRSQFNSLASNFQENMNSLAKLTDKKLNDFRAQTELRFLKFEETISNVDILKEEIEKSQAALKKDLAEDITSYAETIKQDQHRFLSEFSEKSELVCDRMQAIDLSIEELKAKAYTNVSEKLKSFEDEFFADLAKRTELINLNFEQWKDDVSANMALLASENESARKDIEAQYKQELRTRISQAAEEYKTHFLKLDEKVNEIENNLNNRLTAADESIQKYTDKFREYVTELQEKASKNMQSEFSSYKNQIQDAIEVQNAGVETGLQALEEKFSAIRDEANERVEAMKKDFEVWKNRTDQQFTDARSLFEKKITSFAGLTEDAIKNLNAKYNAQYKDFTVKTEENFENLQNRISSLNEKIISADEDIKNNAEQAVLQFTNEVSKIEEDLDKKIKTAESNAEYSVQKVNEMIHAVRIELDDAQEKVREQIQAEAGRLNSVLEEIDKKQNDFIDQTKVFERADELRAGLERDIESIKTEINRFEIYKQAVDNLAEQYDKVTVLEDEANQKIARFMSERKNIELIEAEFVKLTALSDSMDKKIIELTSVNDDLQQYQVQIRRLEEGIGDVNTLYERLEKKDSVLNQTMASIDSAFENLKDLENDIKGFKDDLEALPSEVEKIKVTVDNLLSNKDKAEEICGKLENIDETVDELNAKIDNLKKAREWLAATETRLKEISKDSEAKLKLMSDIFKSEMPERNEKGGPSISMQENVLKLSRQGWKNTEIAKALNLSLGEVDLILEYSDKI